MPSQGIIRCPAEAVWNGRPGAAPCASSINKIENYREDSSLIFLLRPVAAWSSSMVMCILYFQ